MSKLYSRLTELEGIDELSNVEVVHLFSNLLKGEPDKLPKLVDICETELAARVPSFSTDDLANICLFIAEYA